MARARTAHWALLGLALLLAACAQPAVSPSGSGQPAAPLPPPPVPAGRIEVRLIAFNDFHGNLRSPGSFAAAPGARAVPAGGADALAGYVRALRQGHPNVVVVAAGDLVGASPLVSGLSHDEATIEVMNRLGLDLASVGNHEFDAGRSELLRKQQGGCFADGRNTCQGARVGTPVPFEGARFSYLAANVLDATSGKPLLPAYAIRSFDGIRIGFIGITLAGTPTIVTPTGVAGLRFQDEADTVNALIPELKAQGVQSIVVLIHQGGTQGKASLPGAGGINDCVEALQDDSRSPIRGIVRRLDDAVDLVISGHTHMAYDCRLANRTGRLIPVTQAASFGRVITSVDLSYDEASGRPTAVVVQNQVVDRTRSDIPADAGIAKLVDAYGALVEVQEHEVLGTISAAVSTTRSEAGESQAGDLVADAQLEATAPASLGGAAIALMNPGGLRGAGLTAEAYPHDVTYGEAFTLQPFGNSLVVLDLSAQQIKDVLEQQFPGCRGQTTQRILQVSRGLRERWSAGAAPCSHIVDLALTRDGVTDTLVANGVVLAPTRIYRVTVNNYLSTGGDGFTLLAEGRNPLGGAQDIDALLGYIRGFQAPAAAYTPDAAHLRTPRITQLP